MHGAGLSVVLITCVLCIGNSAQFVPPYQHEFRACYYTEQCPFDSTKPIPPSTFRNYLEDALNRSDSKCIFKLDPIYRCVCVIGSGQTGGYVRYGEYCSDDMYNVVCLIIVVIVLTFFALVVLSKYIDYARRIVTPQEI